MVVEDYLRKTQLTGGLWVLTFFNFSFQHVIIRFHPLHQPLLSVERVLHEPEDDLMKRSQCSAPQRHHRLTRYSHFYICYKPQILQYSLYGTSAAKPLFSASHSAFGGGSFGGGHAFAPPASHCNPPAGSHGGPPGGDPFGNGNNGNNQKFQQQQENGKMRYMCKVCAHSEFRGLIPLGS